MGKTLGFTWKINIPMRLTMNPRTETTSNRSCFTSGGSTSLSTASEKMKKDMKRRNKPLMKPEKKCFDFLTGDQNQ